MKKVLVTGADGFIGSHLVEKLEAQNYKVKALAQYNSFNSIGWLKDIELTQNIELFFGDIRDQNFVFELVKDCDVVLHLAALIAIPYSYVAPSSYVETNINGTLNVLNACKLNQVSRLVCTSTSEVYGTASYVPIDEEHALNAQSPYAASKIGADQLALSFARSYNLPITVIRPFNTYGPRQSNRAVIPTIITQILSGARNIKLGNTQPTRDFTYIDDTVAGFIRMIEKDDIFNEVINIGSGFEISIAETADLIASIMGIDNIKIVNEYKRVRPDDSEVERLFADISKAKNLLEWKPQLEGKAGFEIGLSKTIEWFTNPSNLQKYSSNSYVI